MSVSVLGVSRDAVLTDAQWSVIEPLLAVSMAPRRVDVMGPFRLCGH
jgi:hypothetical protein